MIKYEIVYKNEKEKRGERKIVIIIAQNLVELYNLLEKSNINQVIEIKEV